MKNLLVLCLLLVNCGQGPAGNSGASGPQGPAGADNSVTVVQFCPGSVPSYPNVFPEVGIVINNQIYAVYSTLGGFLTLLMPGYYASNAVGSACNFTVNADGTISN